MSLQSQDMQLCKYTECLYECIGAITILLIQYVTFKPLLHENCVYCAQRYESPHCEYELCNGF